MAKVVLNTVNNPATPSGTAVLNENFSKLAAAVENTLSRDGSLPNQLIGDLDLNSNDLLNVKTIDAQDINVDGTNLSVRLDEVVDARDIALAAAVSADQDAITASTNASVATGAAATSTTKAAEADASATRALENATQLVIATQPQAEAASINDKGMTPLRVRQAYDKFGNTSRPETYGAVGDGVTDDTAAVQAAINATSINGTLLLAKTYKITSVTLKTVGVTVTGPGGFIGGTLVIGDATRVSYYILITGVLFDGGAVVAGTATIDGISFRAARRVTITNCRFRNLNKAIHVPQYTGAGFHNTGLLRIYANDFFAVNYGLYVDHDGTVEGWTYTNDCVFSDNYINVAYVGFIYIKGMDGFQASDNVGFFTSGDSSDTALKALRQNGFYIGQSDYLILSGNNIFEPGLDGIVLDKPKHFSITGDKIARPGQNVFGSGIKITGESEVNGSIVAVQVNDFSKYGIEILSSLGTAIATRITISGNLEFDPTGPYYYGTAPLNSIPHYGVYQDPTSPTFIDWIGGSLTNVDNSIRGTTAMDREFNARSRVGSIYCPVTVTTANTKICSLSSRRPQDTTTYGGMIIVEAKNGTGVSNSTAVYRLDLVKGTASSGDISTDSAKGLVAGGNANHPSFTWTFDFATNELRASPIGSTSGAFHFYITYVGDLRVYP